MLIAVGLITWRNMALRTWGTTRLYPWFPFFLHVNEVMFFRYSDAFKVQSSLTFTWLWQQPTWVSDWTVTLNSSHRLNQWLSPAFYIWVKPFLSKHHFELLIHAFLSELVEMNQTPFSRLQLLQNATAHFLSGTKKNTSTSLQFWHCLIGSWLISKFSYLLLKVFLASLRSICPTCCSWTFPYALSGQLIRHFQLTPWTLEKGCLCTSERTHFLFLNPFFKQTVLL